MTFTSWLRSLRSQKTRHPQVGRAKKRATVALRLEECEARTLLAARLVLADGQTLVANANINVSNSSSTVESEMVVAINPTNPLNVAGFVPNHADQNQIQLFFSMNGGASWTRRLISHLSGPGQINDGFGPARLRFDPSIAFDAYGNLLVAYGHEPIGSTVRRLVVARSGDGGNSFSHFFVVETAVGLDKPHIATGPSAPGSSTPAVYIAYSNTGPGAGWPVRVAGLRFGVDAGFTAPVTVSGIGSLAYNISAQPAVGPNGELYVAWHSFSDGATGPGRILIDRDLDGLFTGGANFGNDITVRNLTFSLHFYSVPAHPRRGVHSDPTIGVDRSGGPYHGRVYVAFTDRYAAPADTDIFLATSTDRGASWGALGTIGNVEASTGTDFMPWVAVDQNTGSVNVAYYTTDGAPNNSEVNLRLASSTNGGANFRKANLTSQRSRAASAAYSGEFLEYIGLAALNGTLHGFWADNRGPTQGTFRTDLESYSASASTRHPNNRLVITGDDGGPRSDQIVLRRSVVNADFVEVLMNGRVQWAGLWASLGSITIDAGAMDDDIRIESTPSGVPTTVNAGAGSDTVRVTYNTGFGNEIRGPVTINGEDGTDTVTLTDPNAAVQTWTVTPSTVTRSNAAPITYGTVESVTVYTGRGDTTANILATGTPLTLIGNGPSTVNLGYAGSVQGIRAPMSIYNTAPYTTAVTVDNSNDYMAHTWTHSISGGLGVISGLAPGLIQYGYALASSVTVYTHGGTTANILATGAPFTLIGNDASTVTLGNAGSVQGINGPVSIYNTAPYTTAVTVDDSTDTTAHTWSHSISGGLDVITGLAPRPIYYAYASTSSVTVNGGRGGNTITVENTRAAMTVNAGTGTDRILVVATTGPLAINGQNGTDTVVVGGTAARTQGVRGTVSVTSQAGSIDLVVDDSDEPAVSRTVRLEANRVSGLAGLPSADVTFDPAFLRSLTLWGSRAGNTFTVADTPNNAAFNPRTTLNSGTGTDRILVAGTTGPLAINGRSGTDTVVVGGTAARTQGVRGAVSVTSQAGSIDLVVDDSDEPAVSRTVRLDANRVSGLAPADVTFDPAFLRSLTLWGSRAGNTFTVAATPSVISTLNAGAGDDAITVGNTTDGLDNVRGALIVNGQGGSNTLVVNDAATAPGRDYRLTPSTLSRPGVLINHTGIQNLTVSGTSNSTFSAENDLSALQLRLGARPGTNRLNVTNGSRVRVAAGGDALADDLAVQVGTSAVLDLGGQTALETVGTLTGAAGSQLVLGPGGLRTVTTANTTFVGVVSGTGSLVKDGSGSLLLAGANTYAGQTQVAAGTLVAAHASALGAIAAGTTVNAGATLEVRGDLTVAEPLILRGGTLNSSTATNVWNGLITLDSTSTLAAASGSSLQVRGGITGPTASTLTKAGAGRVVLYTNNFYLGATVVAAGTLGIRAPGSLGPPGSLGTTVNAGGTLQTYEFMYVDEPLTLNSGGQVGTPALVGQSIWRGDVHLATTSAIREISIVGRITGLSGAGLVISGGVGLDGANTYDGPTEVLAGGLLQVRHALALGAASGSTTVHSGATLEVRGDLTIAEPLTLNGGLLLGSFGSPIWAGPVTLAASSRFRSDPTVVGILTVSGPISGPSNSSELRIEPGVAVFLSGNNTYAGPTVVDRTVLVVTSNTALGATTSGTTVLDGGSIELRGVTIGAEPLTLNGQGFFDGTYGTLYSWESTSAWNGPITLATSAALGAFGGTLTVRAVLSGSSGLTKRGDGGVAVMTPLSNSSTLEVREGTLTLNALTTSSAVLITLLGSMAVTGDYIQTGGLTVVDTGSLLIDGSLTIQDGGLVVAGGATVYAITGISNAGSVAVDGFSLLVTDGVYTQTSGDTTLAGGQLNALLVDVQRGILAGSGAIYGEVSNAGQLIVGGAGAAGRLDIFGNYTQTATGQLDIELGGLEQGVEYDFLNIEGTATLDGILNINLLGEYRPSHDDVFAFLATRDGIIGDFAVLNGLDLGDGLSLLPLNDGLGYSLSAYLS